jgi:hypothetical protein
MSRPDTPPSLQPATAYYVDACEQRLRAINLRAAQRSGQGLVSLEFQAPADWCECTARVLESNFETATVRSVGDWFQAVAFGGAERRAEDEHFSQMALTERRRIEAAYDFSTRSCNSQN